MFHLLYNRENCNNTVGTNQQLQGDEQKFF